MKFNSHSNLVGRHATLSASQYHWINYDEAKMRDRFKTQLAAMLGTQFHELAATLIKMGVKLPRNGTTLSSYVNDAIGYRMQPEQILYYSENSFGTADALSFRDNLLRIHDLKTGTTKSSVNQLLIYAALFCLEYGFKPAEIEFELRIYQNDEVIVFDVDKTDIVRIMDKLVTFDKIIAALKEEAFA